MVRVHQRQSNTCIAETAVCLFCFVSFSHFVFQFVPFCYSTFSILLLDENDDDDYNNKNNNKENEIVSGLLCNHKFHRCCIMEWMETGHDHCPYCRKPMMTPNQMRQGAIQVLGIKRVTKLSCGNSSNTHNIVDDDVDNDEESNNQTNITSNHHDNNHNHQDDVEISANVATAAATAATFGEEVAEDGQNKMYTTTTTNNNYDNQFTLEDTSPGTSVITTSTVEVACVNEHGIVEEFTV